jgi:hypothetical protein
VLRGGARRWACGMFRSACSVNILFGNPSDLLRDHGGVALSMVCATVEEQPFRAALRNEARDGLQPPWSPLGLALGAKARLKSRLTRR